VFTFSQVSRAAVVEGLGVSWIELDRLIEIHDRAVKVALCRMGIATIVMGNGKCRRRSLTGIDQRRAAIDTGCKLCAIRAVAQRDVAEIVALLRTLRGSQ
jgi:hypothetical protein